MKSNLTEKEIVGLYRGFFIFGDAAALKILYELERNGTKTFTELKSDLGLNPTTLSKRLKLLVQVGLLSAGNESDKLHVYYKVVNHHKQLKRFLDALERLAYDMQSEIDQ